MYGYHSQFGARVTTESCNNGLEWEEEEGCREETSAGEESTRTCSVSCSPPLC